LTAKPPIPATSRTGSPKDVRANQLVALRTISKIILDIELGQFDLSPRVRNCCVREGIKTIGDLVMSTARNIMTWRNAGLKTLNEIRSLLDSLGLNLADDPKSRRVIAFSTAPKRNQPPKGKPGTKVLRIKPGKP
jgi:hypothetical protein